MEIILKPKKVLVFFIYIIILLTLAHITRHTLLYFFGRSFGLYKFDFNEENNIPTWFAAMELLFAANLLFVIASVKRNNKSSSDFIYWIGLAIIFIFLSIDEYAMFHERIGGILHRTLNTSGFLFYAWVIPYGIFTAIFGITYFRFLVRLPSRTRNFFILAGILFVGGALGLELLGAKSVTTNQTTAYFIFATAEELLEFVGIAIFIYALLSYLNVEHEDLRIRVST